MSARQHAEGIIAGCKAKTLRPVLRAALRQGWTLERRGKGHAMAISPDGSHREPLPLNTKSEALTRVTIRHLVEHGLVLE